jgi:hypothetical protein
VVAALLEFLLERRIGHPMGALALTDCSAALSWALAKVRCIFANDHRIVSGSFRHRLDVLGGLWHGGSCRDYIVKARLLAHVAGRNHTLITPIT